VLTLGDAMSEPVTTIGGPQEALPVRKPWSTPHVITGTAEGETAKSGSAVEVDATIGPTS
jgi:hypothetical protein